MAQNINCDPQTLQRKAALDSYHILDTGQEPASDDIKWLADWLQFYGTGLRSVANCKMHLSKK